MEVSDFFWLITSSLILQVWMLQMIAAQEYRQECRAWDEVVSKLNRMDHEMIMLCKKNKQCTGADCTGRYQYTQFLDDTQIEVEYCFGVALHPCRTPTELHFYVETPDNNQTFQQNVSSASSPYDTGDRLCMYRVAKKINCLHFQTYTLFPSGKTLIIVGIGIHVRGGNARLYIQVGVNHTEMNNKRYMEIQMNSKVKVSVLGIYDQWPKNHQKRLIPPILVPVPDCDQTVATPNYSPGTCMAQGGDTTMAPFGFPTTPHQGKACKQKLADGTYNGFVCGVGEMCGDEGFCVCMFEFHRVNGTCKAGHTTYAPYVFTDKPVTAKNTTTIIIAVCVAIVAFLGMLAVGFFIVKYRQYRARYGNHRLLSEEDDNIADDPLDDVAEDDPPLDLST